MVRNGRALAAWASTAVLAGALAGCGDVGGGTIGGDGGEEDVLRIGFVSTETGSSAPFGEANAYVIEAMEEWFADNPVTVDGSEHAVEIIVKDSQSSSARAGEVAAELINSDGVDLVLTSSTPDITNPVSEQCEANQVPCISTVAPWQPFAIREGDQPADLEYSYHAFWGLEDVSAVYADMWSQVDTNSQAAGLFPNDPDGQAWSANFPALTADTGVTIDDPGLYPNGTQDFSAQLSAFKGHDILVGVPIPPDFTTFWQQAGQQGYQPKIATIGKALLFPSAVEALGNEGDGLTSEVWWHPTAPFSSSLTGQTAQELADQYEADTGKQWTQPLGFAEALFEITVAAVEEAGSTEPDAITEALSTLQVSTVVGDVAWGVDDSVPPYVAKTPLVGGQWRLDEGEDEGAHPYELVVVSNELAPEIPAGGEVEPLR
ncbi:ABC transporter substrate-binding protein [Promicromonospora iranensis]|uniref:Branched-chain amino acid transport system substrate-binding protein n=1 Tax=Promicromonospora iranensis TaxID=1105144 RepID=A0ABU2CQ26_9MICO|nr:ABC transporter substrate-binding protein [Promicromonospora iranensis]MDR7383441.1 branched-chain amino acid transport system substrate-binding protein [Promicromonospora iranensis]